MIVTARLRRNRHNEPSTASRLASIRTDRYDRNRARTYAHDCDSGVVKTDRMVRINDDPRRVTRWSCGGANAGGRAERACVREADFRNPYRRRGPAASPITERPPHKLASAIATTMGLCPIWHPVRRRPAHQALIAAPAGGFPSLAVHLHPHATRRRTMRRTPTCAARQRPSPKQ